MGVGVEEGEEWGLEQSSLPSEKKSLPDTGNAVTGPGGGDGRHSTGTSSHAAAKYFQAREKARSSNESSPSLTESLTLDEARLKLNSSLYRARAQTSKLTRARLIDSPTYTPTILKYKI
ncbi:hypothetical protein OsI_11641 [Oryza sativa Indica Group]|uniref:Uncharacterized protein n=1 Tax=Oryza sativa subsp. indica TaxID=39946 RepID=A2XGW1_ORYSI|nr:hypothetical protein OsI_11641 [Oryza sativa Indica Group]